MESTDWDVVGADNWLRSVHLLCRDCTPARGAERAGQRVLQKYGEDADLRWWTFSVRPAGAGQDSTVRWFSVGEDGRAVPVAM